MRELDRGDTATALPQPADIERSRTGVERWLEAAEREGLQVVAAVRARLANERAHALALAIFGNSPFLTRVVEADPAYSCDAFVQEPDALLARIADSLRGLDAQTTDEVKRGLRIAKRRAALVIAIAEISGSRETAALARAQSDFADTTIAVAARHLLRRMAKAGTITLPHPDEPERGSGLIVIGLGKLGAQELNYSSDVDLIVFYDREIIDTPNPDQLHRAFVNLARDLVAVLSEHTEDGYVFRIDLRLRPDPGATPVAISVEAAETYYESLGQNWERAAMIRARQVAGDPVSGKNFLNGLRPFVWRKHLDFATIQDIHSIKRQINAQYGGAAIAIGGHNIKLGRGGIREIEFFAQTQQLIWGGRVPALRTSGTAAALDALAAEGQIADATARELGESYWYLRRLEHRLQMINDQQTHELPDTAAGLAALATFMGYENRDAFEDDLTRHLRRVEGHYAKLFEDSPALTAANAAGGDLIFTGIEDDPGTLETLRRLGFQDPSVVSQIVRGWHHGRYRATRTERARQILTELMPALLAAFGATPDPNGALRRFDEFLAALPSGVQLFSMFHANPNLLALVADVMGGAPKLSSHLARNPSAMDAVLSPDFFDPPPPADDLRMELDRSLAEARDFQDVLDLCRRWANDRKLQAEVQALRGLIDWTQAGAALSDIAAVAIEALQRCVLDEFAKVHGRIKDAGWVVIAMGKLGGREMTPTSDLDLIFVYDHAAEASTSDGRTPLDPGRYFARLAQRMINAITAPTAEGKLYEVDMRLRPSGTSGPIASHISAFVSYHEDQAWTWEHMALTRARVIGGDAALARKVEAVIAKTLTSPRDPEKLLHDVADMRQRIEREHHAASPWDVKYVAGGLVDIEFVAQYLQLRHAHESPYILCTNTREAIAQACAFGYLASADADTLTGALRLWQAVQSMLRLSLDGDTALGDGDALPEALKQALARAASEPDFVRLTLRMGETAKAAHGIFERIVNRT
jgi:glutamate-ammonia-ligase adenylyltransferase